MASSPPRVLANRYELHERIGAGGHAEVFRATDRMLPIRQLAVKRPLDPLTSDERVLRKARALVEATTLGSLNHYNIVRLIDWLPGDWEEDGGTTPPATVFERIDGPSLAEWLREHRRISPTVVAAILCVVAQALAELARSELVHRDVKPGNLLIDQRDPGRIVLLDFGLSCDINLQGFITAPGQPIGTPGYAAPEQERGDRVDAAADVWSLGKIGEELLAGWKAARGAVPKYLERVIAQCLRPSPEERSAAADVARVLGQGLAKEGASPESVLPVYFSSSEEGADIVPQRKTRRTKGRYVLWGAGAAAVVAATVLVLRPVVQRAATRLRPSVNQAALPPPADPPEWTEAQTLERAHYTASAATLYDKAAAKSEGLRYQATQRAEKLRAANQKKAEAVKEALEVARTQPNSERAIHLVSAFPGYMRWAFHNGVRSAQTLAQVEQFRPLATMLDYQFHCDLHKDYLNRVAKMSFRVRGPLAATYAKLVHDSKALNRMELDRYFAALRKARQWDLLLGALGLTDRVSEDPREYLKLAEKSGDPWFIVHADHKQAMLVYRKGRAIEAHNLLVLARGDCEQERIDYRCTEIDYSLAYVNRVAHRLIEADWYAQRGWTLAQATGEWKYERWFLYELRTIAVLRNDKAKADLLSQELRERDPSDCGNELTGRLSRAKAAIEELRFSDARRELMDAPRCGDTLPFKQIGISAHLDRVGMPVKAWTELRTDIHRLRESGQLSVPLQVYLQQIEGMLLLTHSPDEGRALLRSVIAQADAYSSWDIDVRTARAEAYQELALDAGHALDYESAINYVGRAIGIDGIPACTAAVVVSFERRLLMTHDATGQIQGQYSNGESEFERLAPERLKHVEKCRKVILLGPPILHSHLSPQIAWVYKGDRHIEIDEARQRKSDSSDVPSDSSHPFQILELSPAMLPLTQPFPKVSYSLRGRNGIDPNLISQQHLPSSPLVVLQAVDPMSAFDSPNAFIEARARGVIAVGSGTKDPRAGEFVTRVIARLYKSEPLADALRDERMLWLTQKKESHWVTDIVVYE